MPTRRDSTTHELPPQKLDEAQIHIQWVRKFRKKGGKVTLGKVLTSRDDGKSNTLREKIKQIKELRLTALREAIKTTDSIKEYTTLDEETLRYYYKEDNKHIFFQNLYENILENHGGRKNKTRKKQKGKKRKSIKQKKQKPLKDV
jgi:hypothetical protein